jgi:hypothetical protein
MAISISAQDLLQAIAEAGCFRQVTLHTEGPIIKGYGYISDVLFVRFYVNQHTETIAFALIQNQERIWGIDRDNRRGWHQHPLDAPDSHLGIEPLSMAEIMQEMLSILRKLQLFEDE